MAVIWQKQYVPEVPLTLSDVFYRGSYGLCFNYNKVKPVAFVISMNAEGETLLLFVLTNQNQLNHYIAFLTVMVKVLY